MNNVYYLERMARERVAELLREAAQERLAGSFESGRQYGVRRLAWAAGDALINLGQRLKAGQPLAHDAPGVVLQ